MSYVTVAQHRPMALDRARNTAYWNALREVITADSVVLDLGAGVGIHGLMAARLGARRVYLVEPEDVVHVAEEIAKANRLDGVVQCLKGRVQDVSLPERVNVIVSALTGNFLVAEDLVETLVAARDVHLSPGGVMIPGEAVMEAVPVSAPDLHEREVAGWSVPQHEVDLSEARPLAASSVYFVRDAARGSKSLARPATLHAIDLLKDGYAPVHARVSYRVTEAGTCHGVMGWFRMRLGTTWVSTSPWEQPLHWRPAFLPVDPPLVLEQDEDVSFGLDRPPHGEWTWSLQARAGRRQHSSFLSVPAVPAKLERARPDHRPRLDEAGRAVLDVLSRFDGTTSLAAIARELRQRHPDRYATDHDALAFVQRLSRHYS